MINRFSKALLLSMTLAVGAGQQVQAMSDNNNQKKATWPLTAGETFKSMFFGGCIGSGASLLYHSYRRLQATTSNWQEAVKHVRKAQFSLREAAKCIPDSERMVLYIEELMGMYKYHLNDIQSEIHNSQSLINNSITQMDTSLALQNTALNDLCIGAGLLGIGGMAASYFYLTKPTKTKKSE
ncbi:MAG: hypothetical protein H6679_01715 [Epsilonproteobacteria bacterium]|nr:hypothetical protein [Campylobacterota bacterium]